MAVLLLAFGCVMVPVGYHDIVQSHAELAWHSSSSFSIGPLGWSRPSHGVRVMDGADAVFWGFGFIAFGSMLGVWGLGVGASLFTKQKSEAQVGPVGRGLTWLSFICLLLALLSLFPPWRVASAPFYGTAAVMAWTLAAASRNKHSPVAKRVFPALVLIAVVTGSIGLDHIAVGIILAVFASIFAAVHLVILVPRWQQTLSTHDAPEAD